MSLRALAFYFADESAAKDVHDSLPDCGIDKAEAAVAPLVVNRVDGIVLALTADDQALPAVIALAEQGGGQLVADVPADASATANAKVNG